MRNVPCKMNDARSKRNQIHVTKVRRAALENDFALSVQACSLVAESQKWAGGFSSSDLVVTDSQDIFWEPHHRSSCSQRRMLEGVTD